VTNRVSSAYTYWSLFGPYADFHTITRAHSLRTPTNATREIWEAASELLANRLPARPLRIRLLGVGVSGLEAGGQP
jgi:DNA polymerase-4